MAMFWIHCDLATFFPSWIFRRFFFREMATLYFLTLVIWRYFHFWILSSVFYHEHVLVKEPSARIKTPWHHDQAYYPIDGEDMCSIWMPVDPVSSEATLKFVKGSHKWNQWFYPRKFETSKNYELTTFYDDKKLA